MINHIIYGKIIIDDIRLADGTIARDILGGGGPQAAFGARLWQQSVGLLTRSGTDLAQVHRDALKHLDIDLTGWHQYPDIPTPYNKLAAYDKSEYLCTDEDGLLSRAIDIEAWEQLLAQPVTLPPSYQQARTFHLITEFFDESIVEEALAMREKGTLISLEPIVDYERWQNRDELTALLPHIDVVTPDWPSASGIAGHQSPKAVLAYWAKLGPRLVAVRHGEHGSYVWSQAQDHMWHIPVLPADVVDPTGAGNSYGGGLNVGWAQSGDALWAGCCGTTSARFLVERVGVPQMTEEMQNEANKLAQQLMTRTQLL